MNEGETFSLSTMCVESIDQALLQIENEEQELRNKRRELLNRKAFLLAELYVVATIDGKATLYGVSAKYDVRMPEFIIRMADGSGVIIELLKEDKLMSFPCAVGRALVYKESLSYGDEDKEEVYMFSYDVFKSLEDAEKFVRETNESLLGTESSVK